ncbi:hypothetical protein GW17_00046332 [Ensete ventricosum]|nr:hypothetical protein GW17_00046332 [Ensete ventricosum]
MVYTGTPGDQYADRPLPGSTTLCGLYHLIWVSGGNDRDFNRYRSIPLKREKKEKKRRKYLVRCSSLVPQCDPSPTVKELLAGDSFSP